MPSRRSLLLMLPLLAAVGPARLLAAGDADRGWSALAPSGIVLFRHAEAPGVGDPDGFRLDDCRTQRNLSAEGQSQARRLGKAFRDRGIAVGAVLTSQWCRTRDTAELAFPGLARDDANFNSFFADSGSAAPQTAAAAAMLAAWRGPGVLVVVTHQVNITALTEVVPASGEGVVVKPGAQGLSVTGRLRP